MTAPLDPKKKSRFIKSIGLNVFVSCVFLGFILLYILPAYEEITAKKLVLTTSVNSLNKLTQDGVDVAKYEELIAKYAGIKKTWKLDPEIQKLIAGALKKPEEESKDYLSWVNDELSKGTALTLEDEKNKRIIAGAIPTFLDITGGTPDDFTKSQITLSDLNAYIEQSLLKKHNVESFSPIGFGNINFDAKTNTALNVGTYKLRIDMRGANKNILNLIDTIQKTGEISIKDGKLVEISPPDATASGSQSATPKFNNLLTTIDSVTFSGPLDDLERENTVNMTLVLYVRARNLGDLVALRTQLADQLQKLVTSIDKVSDTCGDLSRVECKNEAVIRAIQGVRGFRNDAADLLKKVQEKLKATPTGDITGEFSELVGLFSSAANLQTQTDTAATVIENVRKQSSK